MRCASCIYEHIGPRFSCLSRLAIAEPSLIASASLALPAILYTMNPPDLIILIMSGTPAP